MSQAAINAKLAVVIPNTPCACGNAFCHCTCQKTIQSLSQQVAQLQQERDHFRFQCAALQAQSVVYDAIKQLVPTLLQFQRQSTSKIGSQPVLPTFKSAQPNIIKQISNKKLLTNSNSIPLRLNPSLSKQLQSNTSNLLPSNQTQIVDLDAPIDESKNNDKNNNNDTADNDEKNIECEIANINNTSGSNLNAKNINNCELCSFESFDQIPQVGVWVHEIQLAESDSTYKDAMQCIKEMVVQDVPIDNQTENYNLNKITELKRKQIADFIDEMRIEEKQKHLLQGYVYAQECVHYAVNIDIVPNHIQPALQQLEQSVAQENPNCLKLFANIDKEVINYANILEKYCKILHLICTPIENNNCNFESVQKYLYPLVALRDKCWKEFVGIINKNHESNVFMGNQLQCEKIVSNDIRNIFDHHFQNYLAQLVSQKLCHIANVIHHKKNDDSKSIYFNLQFRGLMAKIYLSTVDDVYTNEYINDFIALKKCLIDKEYCLHENIDQALNQNNSSK